MPKFEIKSIALGSAVTGILIFVILTVVSFLQTNQGSRFQHIEYSLKTNAFTPVGETQPLTLVSQAVNVIGKIESKDDLGQYTAKIESMVTGGDWKTEYSTNSSSPTLELRYKFTSESAGLIKIRLALYSQPHASQPQSTSQEYVLNVLDLKAKLVSFFDAYNRAWSNDPSTGAYFMASNAYPGLYDTKSRAWENDQDDSIQSGMYVHIEPDYNTLKIAEAYVPDDSRCSAHQTEPLPGLTLAVKTRVAFEDQYNPDVRWNDWYYLAYLNKQIYVFNDWYCLPFNND